jgi:large subunit ribosomal protein L10
MPKTKEQKQQIVGSLTEKFSRMKSAVFAEISGYTMGHANALRAKARQSGCDVFVAKKSLMQRAAKDARLEGVEPAAFKGSVLSILGYENETAPAQMAAALTKEQKGIHILSGVLEGMALDEARVLTLAKLGSKDDMRAQVLRTFNAPMAGLAQVSAGVIRGLVTVLKSIH